MAHRKCYLPPAFRRREKLASVLETAASPLVVTDGRSELP